MAVCSEQALAQPGEGGGEGEKAVEPDVEGESEVAGEHEHEHEHELEAIDVYVEGERAEADGGTTLNKTEMRTMPGAFGDPFRTIEALPGVTPIITGSPYFFVRGAPPGNVGYFFDTIRVPLLYHVGAGPSVIHPSLVKDLEFYPGGYPARYGRYSGGIVAANAQAPPARWRGEASIRVFDAGAMLGAPLPPDDRGAVVVAGRYSYTAAVLSLVAPEVSLSYWDYQAMARYRLSPDDEVSVLAFGAYDFLGEDQGSTTQTIVDSEFYVVDFRYDHRFGPGSTARIATTLGLELTDTGDSADFGVRSHRLRQRVELDHRMSGQTRVRGGADAMAERYAASFAGFAPEEDDVDLRELFPARSDLTMGAWSELQQKLDRRTTLLPGLRLDYYYSDGASALGVDPRLALRYAVLPQLRLVPAVGIAHQPPSFVVPIPGLAIGGLQGGLQRSVQSSFGAEFDLPLDLTGRVTVFNNALFNLSDPLAIARSGMIDEPFDARVTGSSKGLEVFLKRPIANRIGGFLSYTLSRTTRSYGPETFPAAFDRTHVVNGAVSYELGRRWRAGTRLVFYTGFPATGFGGDEEAPALSDAGRTLPFFRVDARLEKRWVIGDRGFVALVFEWLNATLRKEVVDVQCDAYRGCQPVVIGPVTIPSIGVEGGYL
ncbi:MAG: TonB-dependent receptor [Deltaproteobacteria bacterium]|nr:TonB-dependent receptor [Deltaproteobacteria bacterium]MBW2533401.1 TonB-dependent receptor [Deltaproteobacteria bacterium]